MSDRAHVLVVDDEPNIRKLLSGVLQDEGYRVSTAANTEDAEARLAADPADVLLLDVMLPGRDGVSWLRELASAESMPPVIMMSGHATVRTAVEATRLGAVDFIEKPIQVDRLLLSMENALRLQQLQAENVALKQALHGGDELIGRSNSMGRLRDEIARAAPTGARVLITGENGTGKELVARALHRASTRSERAFITVNCAAIPAELLESELFGHEQGAFTGAVRSRRGKFELAQRGTLLLDEIGDMNPTTQAKLLRVLEEEEMERVGGERTIALDVRVLASTNRDLNALRDAGSFREDLYHRLKVIPMHVPALREHAEDVSELAEHYLGHFCRVHGRPGKSLDAAALSRLRAHAWPGNVRELKNLMERLVIMVAGPTIEAGHLALLDTGAEYAGRAGGSLAEQLERFERRTIEQALAASGDNTAEAARALGLDRANLHRKLRRLGLRD